ncbi:hypothetical protein [Inhella gelatinilytica]|uniref:Uncharacterized protein n=1 Tax=Inhella gelatinilytica TaxID=2795030 RepID=A0A931NFG8_9BURK|nr:hypothetical protein [Inhella gelatinilytica]MBH9553536.1 hypothetical protein [Inhella gelatinilytica]
MNRSLTSSHSAAPRSIEGLLSDLESALAGVHEALVQRDADALERHSVSVQRLMAHALAGARQQAWSTQERQRLARAGAQMAAQRVSLSRATAALDRALDTLMPREPLGLYGESGRELKRRSSGDSVSA